MATINFAGNTYAGEVLEDLLVYTAKGNETYEAGLVHVKPGIQKRYTLPHIQLGDIIQDNVPTPAQATGSSLSSDSHGSYTLSERYLDPKDFMVYLEFNPRDFEEYWRFAQPTGPLVFRELDPAVQKTMLRLLLDRKDQYINDCIWCAAIGNSAEARFAKPAGASTILGGFSPAGPMKYFDGALARALSNLKAQAVIATGVEGDITDEMRHEVASGSVILAGATVFNTGKDVEDGLYAMWQKTPSHVRKSKKLKFVMGWETWDLYDQYLTTEKEYKYVENPDVNRRTFKGKQIVVVDGIPDSTIFFGKFSADQESCLWMGIDYNADEESVKVERLQNNSELYFFQMRMKMDVNLVRPGELVLWTPYTVAGMNLSAPAAPVITATGNSIAITCATGGATIQYKIGTGEWTNYTEAITVTSSDDAKTLTAKATKDGQSSAEVTHTIAYSA